MKRRAPNTEVRPLIYRHTPPAEGAEAGWGGVSPILGGGGCCFFFLPREAKVLAPALFVHTTMLLRANCETNTLEVATKALLHEALSLLQAQNI